MGRLEEQALNGARIKPYVWWRFLGDIFMIWTGNTDEPKDFIDYLNNLHPTIKFTSDLSKTSVAFLDTTVSINNCKVSTDLYVKPTDTHQYLLSSSCHPYHTKRSIPYNLGLRLRRICSGDTTFRRRCDELSEQLRTETGLQAITGTTRNHQSTTCYTRSSLTTEPLTTKT